MDNLDIESGKLNQSPPSYMAIGSSRPNQAILIKQPEVLKLTRRGVAILICPFENKEVTTKISYQPGFKVLFGAIAFFLIFLVILLPLMFLELYFIMLYYILFYLFLGTFILSRDFFLLQVHHCPSCDRIVAIAK